MITGAFQNNVRQLLGRLSIPIAALALLLSGQPSQGQSLKQSYYQDRARELEERQLYQKITRQKANDIKEAQYGMQPRIHDRHRENVFRYFYPWYLMKEPPLLFKIQDGVVFRFWFAGVGTSRKAMAWGTGTGWVKAGMLNKVTEQHTYLIGWGGSKKYLSEYVYESGRLCQYIKRPNPGAEITKECYLQLAPENIQAVVEAFLHDKNRWEY